MTRRWGAPIAGVGLLLVLVPLVALVVTNRDPDEAFTHAWWSPLAEVPVETLAVGTVGLALLVGVLVAAVIARLVRRRRVAPVLALLLAAVLAGGMFAVGIGRARDSAACMRTVLAGGSTDASPEAVHAFRLALALPAAADRPVDITARSSLPAGPLLVQTVEVHHPDLGDEFTDITVGALVDPLTGRVIAAWFFGL